MRVGVVYAAAAFAVLEFADIAFPRLGLPDAAVNWVLVLGLAGFPVALVLAWVFDIRRDSQATGATGRNVPWLSVSAVVSAIALIGLGVAAGRFWGTTGSGENAPARNNSIAVIPFVNISGDDATEPFTVGIHDDILTHLSRVRDLTVISRTSVLAYRATEKPASTIGAELGVATVLEGGVQRVGDMLRVNVRLTDAQTDSQLWTRSFDERWSAENVFSIQRDIAISVAETMQASVTSIERARIAKVPTRNVAALETYFVGKQLLEDRNVKSLSAAVEYFQQVIKLDPDFALAHSGLADAYMLLPEYSATIDRSMVRAQSEASVTRAFALDPEIPEVLTSMGWNRLIHAYDWRGAEDLLRRALAIEANNTNALHWLSHVMSWQGQHTEAIALARQAAEVDPLSAIMLRNVSYMYMDAADYETAIRVSEEVRQRFPDHSSATRDQWLLYLRAGRAERTVDAMTRWYAATGRDVAAAQELGRLLVDYAATGQPRTIPDELVARVAIGSNFMPTFYAYVGDGESALDALESAYAERSGSRSLLSMGIEPGFDFIRDEPRFVALLNAVGLKP